MQSIVFIKILQHDNVSCQEKFLLCHLKIKTGLFFNDLRFKSELLKIT